MGKTKMKIDIEMEMELACGPYGHPSVLVPIMDLSICKTINEEVG